MGKAINPKGKKAPSKRGRKKKSLQERVEEIKTKSLSIKSIIEGGNLEKLKDFEHLFTKSMADQLGVNHGRFIDKLKNPVKFSTKELFRFAYYINTAPDHILLQVRKEIEGNKKVLLTLQQFKPVKKKA